MTKFITIKLLLYCLVFLIWSSVTGCPALQSSGNELSGHQMVTVHVMKAINFYASLSLSSTITVVDKKMTLYLETPYQASQWFKHKSIYSMADQFTKLKINLNNHDCFSPDRARSKHQIWITKLKKHSAQILCSPGTLVHFDPIKLLEQACEQG